MSKSSILSALRRNLKRFFNTGNYENAVITGDLLIDYYKTNIGNSCDFSQYSDDFFVMGEANFAVKDYDKAHMLYKESLNSLTNNVKDENYAYRLNNIGIIHSMRKEHGEAIKAHKEAFKILMESLGENNHHVIDSLYNLGNAYYDDKNFSSAIKCLKRVLYLKRENDDGYVDHLNSLGYAYEAKGEIEGAYRCLVNALVLNCKLYGKKSETYLSDLNYIANFCYKHDLQLRAIGHYKEFIEIAPDVIGKNNIYYINALYNYSETARINDDEENVLKAKIELLELYKNYAGESNIFTANNLTIIALIYKNRRDYKKAIEYCEKALEIKKILIGEEGLGYIKDLILLSTFYFESRQFTKTIETVSNLMEIIEKGGITLNESAFEKGRLYLYSDKHHFNLALESYVSYDVESLEALLGDIYKNIDV